MASVWRNKAILFGIGTGMIALVVIILGTVINGRLFIQWNILFFAVTSLLGMMLLARKLTSEFGFMGFNELLKPLMVLFIFAYIIYNLGFMGYESFFNPKLSEIKYEISAEQFEKYADRMDKKQREEAKVLLDNPDNFKPGFTLQGFLFSFGLFFAVIGLPESILVAALTNRGFHNEEKKMIERNP